MEISFFSFTINTIFNNESSVWVYCNNPYYWNDYKIWKYEKSGLKVLINCSQGIQRSCAVCACLLVQYKHYITKDDLKRIKGLLDNEITLEGLV